jgi:hypothetical protein
MWKQNPQQSVTVSHTHSLTHTHTQYQHKKVYSRVKERERERTTMLYTSTVFHYSPGYSTSTVFHYSPRYSDLLLLLYVIFSTVFHGGISLSLVEQISLLQRVSEDVWTEPFPVWSELSVPVQEPHMSLLWISEITSVFWPPIIGDLHENKPTQKDTTWTWQILPSLCHQKVMTPTLGCTLKSWISSRTQSFSVWATFNPALIADTWWD